MKKLGIALIAILLCASLLVACTPGYTLDRLFSFLGESATDGNAYYYSTYGNYIYVSNGNIVSYGNAAVSSGNVLAASSGNAAASSGNATPASSGNAAGQIGWEIAAPASLTPTPVPHN